MSSARAFLNLVEDGGEWSAAGSGCITSM